MIYTPQNTDEIQSILAQAMDSQRPLYACGTRTKSGMHCQVSAEDSLSMEHYSGIIDYEPEELVLVVRAGTRLDEIDQLLAKHNQMLAFEPANLSKMFASEYGGTIGGIIATNLSGSRRISAGAARDYLLGFDAISGRCDQFKSGSRVMKNVTGYDLSKLMCGSYGRLAILSDITLKVLPKPQTVQTVCLTTDTLAEAQAIVSQAFTSSVEPSGGAILPVADRFTSYIRLEGVAVSVADRLTALKNILDGQGEVSVLEADESTLFWQQITNAEQLASSSGQIWKLSIVPSALPQIIEIISSAHTCSYIADWAGGLVWLNCEISDTAASGAIIRNAISAHGGGHAHLVRGEAGEHIAKFQPQPEQLALLQSRIKTAFDPLHILNPDIMGHEVPDSTARADAGEKE